jgi:probable F420-dependent oxidoreductase
MEYGVVFPQTEFGHDPATIKDYAQAAEALGYHYILAYDHVLGANPNRPGGWSGPYTHQNPFMEPFTLFSFMAGATYNLGFATGILILPQRKTALVAKQAATLDILCGGRLRLGIGLGWNAVEYEALGEDFHTRGKRVEEQVQVLRRLWTSPLVNFQGRWHTISDAGINPLPIQQPIPIWFGGSTEAVYDRTARIGNGWMADTREPDEAAPVIQKIRARMKELERDPQSLGVEARISYGDGNPGNLSALINGWTKAGATHISINTMKAGLDSPAEHILAIEKFMKIVVGI